MGAKPAKSASASEGFLGLGTAFNALMLFWFAEAGGKALGLVTWDSGVSSGKAKE